MTASKTKQVFKNLCAMSLAATIGGAALTALPTDADATVFSGSYVVNPHNTDPGILISTYRNGPMWESNRFTTSDIPEGGTYTRGLFRIWIPKGGKGERTVGVNDQVLKPISVQFTFTAPSPFGGTAHGNTGGVSAGYETYQYGEVTWNGPLTLNYPGGNGALKITLSDETFDYGCVGCSGYAIVNVTFTNMADPTPAPEPATLAVLSLGLVGLGWAARRRKQEV